MKKFFNNLFFNINMSWLKVIILSILSALFSALMLIIPFTVHTSLSAPGTTFEFWVFMALIIIMNCEKPLEAALKTFVFFLISQPLIYLFQVPFSYLGWDLFMFYKQWFVITLLTFPGAFIAWYIKKDNLLSVLILSVASFILAYMGKYYYSYVVNRFPFYSLAFIFCFAQAYGLGVILLKNKTNKIISLILTLCMTLIIFLL